MSEALFVVFAVVVVAAVAYWGAQESKKPFPPIPPTPTTPVSLDPYAGAPKAVVAACRKLGIYPETLRTMLQDERTASFLKSISKHPTFADPEKALVATIEWVRDEAQRNRDEIEAKETADWLAYRTKETNDWLKGAR